MQRTRYSVFFSVASLIKHHIYKSVKSEFRREDEGDDEDREEEGDGEKYLNLENVHPRGFVAK